MKKTIYKKITLGRDNNKKNTSKIFKEISLRNDKYKEQNSFLLEIKSKYNDNQNRVAKSLNNDYCIKKKEKNKSKNNSEDKKMNTSFYNPKIKFFNSLINQKLGNGQNCNIIKVHSHNISFDYSTLYPNKSKDYNKIIHLKKKNTRKKKSVFNNYFNNILTKSTNQKEDNYLFKEYTNNNISNSLFKHMLFKNLYQKIFDSKNFDFIKNLKSNLSLSTYNEDDKYITRYFNKNSKRTNKLFYETILKKKKINESQIDSLINKSYSSKFIDYCNLRKNSTKLNFSFSIQSLEKFDEVIKNDKKINLNNSMNFTFKRDSFSQT